MSLGRPVSAVTCQALTPATPVSNSNQPSPAESQRTWYITLTTLDKLSTIVVDKLTTYSDRGNGRTHVDRPARLFQLKLWLQLRFDCIQLRYDYDATRAPASFRREQKMNVSIFARDSIYAKRAYAIAIPSVCLSVCLSVTRVDQSKTVEVRIMQFSPTVAPSL